MSTRLVLGVSLTLWVAFPCSACGDFPVRRGRQVLGRSRECDFVINHPTVSREHAELNVIGDTITLTDLGSSNGTFVDGKRIKTCELQRGQWLELGAVRFLLEGGDCQAGLETADDIDMSSLTQLENAKATIEGPVEAPALLSGAQQRVYELLLSGASYKQIAARLTLSQHTVHNHVRAIYRALNVHSRSELFARHIENELDREE